MTRDELAALFADVIGLRLRPVEIATLLTAVERYVDNCLMIALEAVDSTPLPGTGE